MWEEGWPVPRLESLWRGRDGMSPSWKRVSAAQDKICGEFLSYEALGYLGRLGLAVSSLGAVPIERVRLVANHVLGEADLPFAAMSLTRKALDEAVLRKGAEAGARVHRGHRVESLEKQGDEWCGAIEGGTRLRSSTGFLATGKHDLYEHARPAGKQNELVAFRMCFRLDHVQQDALDRHVDLILFPVDTRDCSWWKAEWLTFACWLSVKY